MSPQEELRELIALLAVDALEGDERAAAERAAADDPMLAAELAAHHEALALLVPSAPAPAGLWDRIASELADEPAAATVSVREAQVIPLRPRRARLYGGVAAGVAAVAAAVAITVAVTGGDDGSDLGRPLATAGIEAKDAALPVAGAVHLFDPDRAGGVLVVDLTSVPACPEGHHYEVWVLRADSAEMEAVGSFVPDATSTRLELPLPGPGTYAAFDISIEEDGGPPEHSGRSVAGATFL